MAYILAIESSTDVCSVSLIKDREIIRTEETKVANSHSADLAVFTDLIFNETKISPKELSAISVSMGPGSYTGLRIGVSFAKGLCWGLNIPLIGINTLKLMASQFISENLADNSAPPDNKILLGPMIDARRQEVYCAIYDKSLNDIRETTAEIINAESFSEYDSASTIIFFGNGALKCKNIIERQNCIFDESFILSSRGHKELAFDAFERKDFVDTAYFEPYYLKDFVAIPNKKIDRLLNRD